MISNTIHVRASPEVVTNILSQLPAAARSGGTVQDAMMTRCGMTALGRIGRAFLVKSRGGTDEAGDTWQPLSPKTIAYSRTRSRGKGGRTKTERGRGSRPSQALSEKQQVRWWQVYKRQLAIYKGNKAHAAAVAWIVLKREGARTILDKYGNRKVDILFDTGVLLASLSPGENSAESVFRVAPGEVIVGTTRKGAAAHHHGVPGKLPQRRLWPHPSRWPSSWWLDILEQLQQGLMDLAVSTLKGAG